MLAEMKVAAESFNGFSEDDPDWQSIRGDYPQEDHEPRHEPTEWEIARDNLQDDLEMNGLTATDSLFTDVMTRFDAWMKAVEAGEALQNTEYLREQLQAALDIVPAASQSPHRQ